MEEEEQWCMQSSFVLQPRLTRELVSPWKWLLRHVKPGVGQGSWCWGQTALKTNEVFIWEVGRLKCAGLCPWLPSVRIPETPEKTGLVLVWLPQALMAFLTQKMQFVHLLTNTSVFFLYWQLVWVGFLMDVWFTVFVLGFCIVDIRGDWHNLDLSRTQVTN